MADDRKRKHGHGHHGHCHDHGQANYGRAFAIGTALNMGFVLVEAFYGYFAHSLALFADAGHNLSDVLGLLLAMGSIAWEAIRRFSEPSPIAGGMVIGVAVIGIAINGGTALLFMSGRKGDLNIRGAFLHMVADAFVSLGVVLAGIAILATGWLWFDPVVSLIIVAVVVVGTWELLRDSVNLALDGVPENIELLAVRTYLEELPGVVEAHDLHIWAMSTSETALTAHLVMLAGSPGDGFLSRIAMELQEKFGIEHTTIQIEMGNFLRACDQKSCCS